MSPREYGNNLRDHSERVTWGISSAREPLETRPVSPANFVPIGIGWGREFESLSTGLKRRTLLGKAIAGKPDVLLLDEPTNHLDIDAITWLEGFLANLAATLIFVTHDRAFLTRLATRILEVDRGRLFDWACDYQTFLKRKEQALLAEEKQQALFDRKLAEEEVWIRTGIKARRTRNEGRVRRLEEMRRNRSQRPKAVGEVRMQIDTGERSGNLVCHLEGASFGYDGKTIVKPFDLTIMRGDKVGILGAKRDWQIDTAQGNSRAIGAIEWFGANGDQA